MINFKVKIFYIKLLSLLSFLLFPNLSLSEKLLAKNSNFEWHPVGVDNYGNITQWINLLSYKTLNNDSFRMQMKLVEGNKQILGRLDINCRNKDYYLRKRKQMSQRGTWNSLEKEQAMKRSLNFIVKIRLRHLFGVIHQQLNTYGISKNLHIQLQIIKGIGLVYIKITLASLNIIRIYKRKMVIF